MIALGGHGGVTAAAPIGGTWGAGRGASFLGENDLRQGFPPSYSFLRGGGRVMRVAVFRTQSSQELKKSWRSFCLECGRKSACRWRPTCGLSSALQAKSPPLHLA